MKKGTVLTICILLIALTAFITQAGKLLVVNQKPVKSDVIIVLSGDKGCRTEYGVKLFKEGYGKYILFTGGPIYYKTTAAKLMKDHALQLGVPASAIILEEKADSTYENAVYTKPIMKKYHLKSAIIVTSNYHTRRSENLFNRVFKGSGIVLTVCASNDQYFKPDKWWSSNKSILITVNEYFKLIGYWLGKNT